MSFKIDHQLIPSNHNNKKIVYDVQLPDGNGQYPVIIFCHGFKGFKDWGHFNLVSKHFADHGFATIKINFSHNGTSPEKPFDFVDLEAFGKNNFSIELDDLDQLISQISYGGNQLIKNKLNTNQIYLLGHSKGGSTAIIKSIEDERIKGVITWAAVADIYNRYSEDEMGDWKKDGVKYIYNARTDQNMPLYYQLAQDVIQNKRRFDISNVVKDLSKPFLIVHGLDDETVDVKEATLLHNNSVNSELYIIDSCGHTFGGCHPWNESILPKPTLEACKKTIEFLTSIV